MALAFMKLAVCLFVGMDARSRAMAECAARLEFPDATLLEFKTLPEALKQEAALGGELLVLANPEPGSLVQAVEATDGVGLRRWAIVCLGAAPAAKGVEIVSLEEGDEHRLSRAFRSAVVQHQLLCETERTQGDLRTVAYRISHDLRTPLGGILSAGEALKEILTEHEPANVALTKPLFDSVDDLGKLIARLSLVLKASVNPVAKRPVAMGEVVWAVLQQQERQIIQQGAVVTQPDSWPEVEAVASWLEVVWGNLVSNALRHGKANARIELGWSQNGREFRFWVSDDGDGVPLEKLGDLFQPFHLLHHPNARKGLGLSIVQRLLDLQGGYCGYGHPVAGGTTFFFTLPAGKYATVTPSLSATSDQKLRPATQT